MFVSKDKNFIWNVGDVIICIKDSRQKRIRVGSKLVICSVSEDWYDVYNDVYHRKFTASNPSTNIEMAKCNSNFFNSEHWMLYSDYILDKKLECLNESR